MPYSFSYDTAPPALLLVMHYKIVKAVVPPVGLEPTPSKLTMRSVTSLFVVKAFLCRIYFVVYMVHLVNWVKQLPYECRMKSYNASHCSLMESAKSSKLVSQSPA